MIKLPTSPDCKHAGARSRPYITFRCNRTVWYCPRCKKTWVQDGGIFSPVAIKLAEELVGMFR